MCIFILCSMFSFDKRVNTWEYFLLLATNNWHAKKRQELSAVFTKITHCQSQFDEDCARHFARNVADWEQEKSHDDVHGKYDFHPLAFSSWMTWQLFSWYIFLLWPITHPVLKITHIFHGFFRVDVVVVKILKKRIRTYDSKLLCDLGKSSPSLIPPEE